MLSLHFFIVGNVSVQQSSQLLGAQVIQAQEMEKYLQMYIFYSH